MMTTRRRGIKVAVFLGTQDAALRRVSLPSAACEGALSDSKFRSMLRDASNGLILSSYFSLS